MAEAEEPEAPARGFITRRTMHSNAMSQGWRLKLFGGFVALLPCSKFLGQETEAYWRPAGHWMSWHGPAMIPATSHGTMRPVIADMHLQRWDVVGGS